MEAVLFRLVIAVSLCLAVAAPAAAQGSDPAPVIAIETSKGTFWFETFPKEAPVSVKHIVALVRDGFYNGQRIHRALAGFLVQFGDPQTRDLNARARWGRGAEAASGTPVGVAEVNERRLHRRGTVGLAHRGNPEAADSQIYITLEDRRELNGHYAVVGQVIRGLEVLDDLQVGDQILRAYVD